jgi:hypothetical protein
VRGLARRDFLLTSGAFVAGTSLGLVASRHWLLRYTEPGKQYVLQQKQANLTRRLLSPEGRLIPVSFQGSLGALVDAGVIDPEKLNRLYAQRNARIPDWLDTALRSTSPEPMRISPGSAPFLLNVLWALGLSNRTEFNRRSPLQGENLPRFASTAGWVLGREPNGAAYFNSVPAVRLTGSQDRLVLEMAEGIYRPCCDNSTFFQDCNHGSAMLGLLELGASQGAEEGALWNLALVANIHWFPDNYLKIALYFEEVEGRAFGEVDAKKVLSRGFSAASGFNTNVLMRLVEGGLLPHSRGRDSAGCSV